MRATVVAVLLLVLARAALAQVSADPLPFSGTLDAFRNPITGQKTPLAAKFDSGLELAREEQSRVRGDLSQWRTRMRRELPAARVTTNGLVLITAVAQTSSTVLVEELRALGADHIASHARLISAWIPAAALDRLADSHALRFGRISYARRSVGLVTSQGDTALSAAAARANTGFSGAGITIGAMSDSYNCLGGAAANVAGNDLPAGVQVLEDASALPGGCAAAGGTDEGRAMLQIAHDLAPGAGAAFYTAVGGLADFANGIEQLASIAKAGVIVDDVYYFEEPMFQDGSVAQAIGSVVAAGVSYFSAAGNYAAQSYQNTFSTSTVVDPTVGGFRHNFAPSGPAVTLQPVTIPANATIILALEWDQPFFSVSGAPGSTNNVDILIYDAAGVNVVTGSAGNAIGGDPVKALSWTNPGPATSFNLAIVWNGGGKPGTIKYIYDGSMTIGAFATNSSTIAGHANAASARAVAAAYYGNTPAYGTAPALLESYSSLGGTPILFDTSGNRLATPLQRLKPEFTAVDGIDTTFFGVDTDGDGYPNFYGTSAAAPHVAAIAALMRQANPNATPAAIDAALEDTTVSMSTSAFDARSGDGLVQATGAVAAIMALSVNDYVGFSSLPNGTPISGSFAGNAYAAAGIGAISVSGRSDGMVGIGPGPSRPSVSGFTGDTILATGTVGSTEVALSFSPSVSAVSFAFASASGQVQVQVFGPTGAQLSSATLTGTESVSFGGASRLAGHAAISGLGAIGQIVVRSAGSDTDLRVGDVVLNGFSGNGGATGGGSDGPIPIWALLMLAGLLIGASSLTLRRQAAIAGRR